MQMICKWENHELAGASCEVAENLQLAVIPLCINRKVAETSQLIEIPLWTNCKLTAH